MEAFKYLLNFLFDELFVTKINQKCCNTLSAGKDSSARCPIGVLKFAD